MSTAASRAAHRDDIALHADVPTQSHDGSAGGPGLEGRGLPKVVWPAVAVAQPGRPPKSVMAVLPVPLQGLVSFACTLNQSSPYRAGHMQHRPS